MGDALIYKLARSVEVGDFLWMSAAERSYRVVAIVDHEGDGLGFVVARSSGIALELPPIAADDTVELEVMT